MNECIDSTMGRIHVCLLCCLLMTITDVVKQAEVDKYVTSSLVLSFVHTCMKNLVEDGSIDQPWFGPANPQREFPVSSAHESIKVARLSISQDLQDRWVTNSNEDRKSFFLIASLLDPHTKSLIFCDDKHFPTSFQHKGHGFLAMEFKSFYREIQDTQVDLLHQDAQKVGRFLDTSAYPIGSCIRAAAGPNRRVVRLGV